MPKLTGCFEWISITYVNFSSKSGEASELYEEAAKSFAQYYQFCPTASNRKRLVTCYLQAASGRIRIQDLEHVGQLYQECLPILLSIRDGDRSDEEDRNIREMGEFLLQQHLAPVRLMKKGGRSEQREELESLCRKITEKQKSPNQRTEWFRKVAIETAKAADSNKSKRIPHLIYMSASYYYKAAVSQSEGEGKETSASLSYIEAAVGLFRQLKPQELNEENELYEAQNAPASSQDKQDEKLSPIFQYHICLQTLARCAQAKNRKVELLEESGDVFKGAVSKKNPSAHFRVQSLSYQAAADAIGGEEKDVAELAHKAKLYEQAGESLYKCIPLDDNDVSKVAHFFEIAADNWAKTRELKKAVSLYEKAAQILGEHNKNEDAGYLYEKAANYWNTVKALETAASFYEKAAQSFIKCDKNKKAGYLYEKAAGTLSLKAELSDKESEDIDTWYRDAVQQVQKYKTSDDNKKKMQVGLLQRLFEHYEKMVNVTYKAKDVQNRTKFLVKAVNTSSELIQLFGNSDDQAYRQHLNKSLSFYYMLMTTYSNQKAWEDVIQLDKQMSFNRMEEKGDFLKKVEDERGMMGIYLYALYSMQVGEAYSQKGQWEQACRRCDIAIKMWDYLIEKKFGVENGQYGRCVRHRINSLKNAAGAYDSLKEYSQAGLNYFLAAQASADLKKGLPSASEPQIQEWEKSLSDCCQKCQLAYLKTLKSFNSMDNQGKDKSKKMKKIGQEMAKGYGNVGICLMFTKNYEEAIQKFGEARQWLKCGYKNSSQHIKDQDDHYQKLITTCEKELSQLRAASKKRKGEESIASSSTSYEAKEIKDSKEAKREVQYAVSQKSSSSSSHSVAMEQYREQQDNEGSLRVKRTKLDPKTEENRIGQKYQTSSRLQQMLSNPFPMVSSSSSFQNSFPMASSSSSFSSHSFQHQFPTASSSSSFQHQFPTASSSSSSRIQFSTAPSSSSFQYFNAGGVATKGQITTRVADPSNGSWIGSMVSSIFSPPATVSPIVQPIGLTVDRQKAEEKQQPTALSNVPAGMHSSLPLQSLPTLPPRPQSTPQQYSFFKTTAEKKRESQSQKNVTPFFAHRP